MQPCLIGAFQNTQPFLMVAFDIENGRCVDVGSSFKNSFFVILPSVLFCLVLFAFRQIGREGKKDLAENPIDITDELKNPELEREYKPEEKVPNWVLFVLCGLAPAVFLFCYALRYGQQQQGHEYESLGSFFRSISSTWFCTDVLKVRCARPRPHACQKLQEYFDITTKTCKDGKDPQKLWDAFRSFPSAHASLSFTTMARVSLELMQILPMWPLYWLAWTPMVLAFFIAWTRLRDYWHHLEDVIAGAILGIVFAFLDNWIVVCSIIFLLILVDQLIIKETKRKRDETKVVGLPVTRSDNAPTGINKIRLTARRLEKALDTLTGINNTVLIIPVRSFVDCLFLAEQPETGGNSSRSRCRGRTMGAGVVITTGTGQGLARAPLVRRQSPMASSLKQTYSTIGE